LGASNPNGTFYGVAVDLGSNLYMTAQTLSATANNALPFFSPFNVFGRGGYALPSSAQNAAYLIGYTPSGGVSGYTNLVGSGACVGQGIAVDALSNVYFTGYYTNTGTSNLNNIYSTAFTTSPFPSPYVLPISSTSSMFLIKYSNAGSVLSFTNLTGSGTCQGYGLATDAGSNVYVAGQYINTSPTTINILGNNPRIQSSFNTFGASSSGSAFMLAYSPSGALLECVNLLGGTGASSYRGIAADIGSNVYVTGGCTSTSNVALNVFGPSSYFPVSSTNSEFMIAYSPTGNVIGFTNFSGTGACAGRAVTVDLGSNIYTTGSYTSTSNAFLYGSATGGYVLAQISQNTMFLLEYGLSGNILGLASLSGTGACAGYGLAVDSSSNVFLTGSYTNTGTSVINNLALNNTLQASGNTFAGTGEFMIAYNPTGNVIGFTNFSGTGACTGRGVTVDLGSNIYTTGSYTSTSNIITTPIVPFFVLGSGSSLPTCAVSTSFLIEYTPTGSLVGFTPIGNGTIASLAYSVAADAGSNVYVTGYYLAGGVSGTGPQIFNIANSSVPIFSGFPLPTITGSGSSYIIKYSKTGSVLAFTNIVGVAGSIAYSTTCDSGSNVYVGGYIANAGGAPVNNLVLSSTTQSSGNTFPASGTNNSEFLLVFNPSGNVIAFNGFSSGTSSSVRGITVDLGSNIYTTGAYTSTSNIIIPNFTVPSSFLPFPSSTQNAAFLIMYTLTGNIIGFTNLTGTGACVGTSLATDALSNVILTGTYINTGTTAISNISGSIVNSGFTLPATTTQGMYIIKYSNVGNVLSFTNLTGTVACTGSGVSTDGSSNIYVCGTYNSTSNTSVNTMSLNSPPLNYANLFAVNNSSGFIFSYAPSGNVAAYTTVPSVYGQTGITNPSGGWSPFTLFNTIVADSGSNVYCMGNTQFNSLQSVSNTNVPVLFSNLITSYPILDPLPYSFINYNSPAPYVPQKYSPLILKLDPTGETSSPVQITLQNPTSPSYVSLKNLYNNNAANSNLWVYINNTPVVLRVKQSLDWIPNKWIFTAAS
jgi:hypothetical protein